MSRPQGSSNSRMRDYVLYVVISLAVLIAFFALVSTGVSVDAIGRWGGLVCFTTLIYGYFIAGNRPLFRRRSFWALTFCFLAVHTAVFVIVLLHVAHWKTIWFMAMFLELPVLSFFQTHLRGKTRHRELS
jgi:hypothetical protein